MDCNKDEAARAKEISEKKFISKDIAGAKKFALKAQNLYPDLDGISSMLATLDVYISAEKQICGESDWYGVLAVHPLDDDETIRRQYRKLALMLHPDKNKSIGAEGAFKFISQAWSLLSDKTKRLLYDQKRNSYLNKQQPSSSGYSAANPHGSNGFFNFSQSTKVGPSHKPKPPTDSSHKVKTANVPSSSHKEKPTSFWTCCHRCKMQYEYLRMYLNHNLLCPNCHKPFIAHETKPPGSKVSTEWNFSGEQQQNSNRQSRQKNKNEWGPFSKATSAASAAQASDMVKQTYNKVKREREEAQAAIKREEALRRKNRKTTLSFSTHGNSKRRKGVDDLGGGFNPAVLASGARSISLSLYNKNKNLEQGTVSGISKIQYLLMEKARMEIRNKLKEWSSANLEVNVPNKSKDIQKEKTFVDRVAAEKSIQPISVEVSDPEFHNFDGDRTESCYGENEVWAAYDDDDGMPRHYAMIHKLISSDPFKIRICWLNPKTNDNLDNLGFPKTCGDFRVGKNEISKLPNLFSHKVRWSKGRFDEIQIYPRKGEVWALYRNWSPQWNEFIDTEVIHKYDIVEVVEGYDDDDDEEGESGVSVIPLVKVAGFKTVFHHHLDPKEKKKIPQQETFRFSHQIPSYLITGQETLNAPKGCWELDPAAIPPEFLEVIRCDKEMDMLEIEEKINEGNIVEEL